MWKCKVCDLQFVDNKNIVKDHLEQQHALDVKEYSKTFNLPENNDDSTMEENTEDVENDESSSLEVSTVSVSTPATTTTTTSSGTKCLDNYFVAVSHCFLN